MGEVRRGSAGSLPVTWERFDRWQERPLPVANVPAPTPVPDEKATDVRVASRLTLVLALLCTAPAGVDMVERTGADTPTTPASRSDARVQPVLERPAAPVPAPGPATDDDADRQPAAEAPRYRPVEASRVAIRIDQVAKPGIVRKVQRIEGVRRATAVQLGRSPVGAGPDAPTLTVAAVDPAGYRPFAPQVVADEVGVWQRLDDGEVAVMHEHAERLGVPLGGTLPLGGQHGVPLRIGALATVGLPPIADAMVDRATGARLGLAEVPPTVLVATEDGAEVGSVAADIEEQLGVDATIVPDPRERTTTGARPPQGDTVWDRLAQCESSGNWHVNTGNGYYGGLQFLPESWRLVGGTGMPHEATREEQIHRAELLLERQGWIAWPVCSVVIGVREPS